MVQLEFFFKRHHDATHWTHGWKPQTPCRTLLWCGHKLTFSSCMTATGSSRSRGAVNMRRAGPGGPLLKEAPPVGTLGASPQACHKSPHSRQARPPSPRRMADYNCHFPEAKLTTSPTPVITWKGRASLWWPQQLQSAAAEGV